jgi:hypothetical protein
MGYARTGPLVADKFHDAIQYAAEAGRIELGANGNWKVTNEELRNATR